MQNDNIKKVVEMLKVANDGLNKADFLRAFESLSNAIKRVETYLNEKFTKLREELLDKIDNKLATIKDGYSPIKGKDYFDGNDGYTPIKGVDYFDGEHGKDADEEAILSKLEKTLTPLIPKELDGEEIANRLEELPESKKLEIDAIKGLWDELKKLRAIKTSGTGGGVSGRDIIKVYDLSGSLDGVTSTFSIPSFWRILSVNFSSAPWIARPTVDYTASASQITFTSEIDPASTLASGQTVTIVYVTG